MPRAQLSLEELRENVRLARERKTAALSAECACVGDVIARGAELADAQRDLARWKRRLARAMRAADDWTQGRPQWEIEDAYAEHTS